MKCEPEVIAEGATNHGSFRIIRNDDAPPTPWITRHDFWDWLWTHPKYVCEELFGTNIDPLCALYDVPRPAYTSARTNKCRVRQPLNPARDANEPVPLIRFVPAYKWSSGEYIGQCPLIFGPDAQVGGPTENGRIYPRSNEDGLLALPAIGNRGQLVRLSRFDQGPPPALTRSVLRAEAKGLMGIGPWPFLGLYGLTLQLVLKLLQREGIACYPPLWKWADYDWHDPFTGPVQTVHKRLSAAQAKQFVDLSPEARSILEEQVASDLREGEERRRNKRDKTVASIARQRATAEEKFDAVLRLACTGKEFVEAAAELAVPKAYLAKLIHDRLKARLPNGNPRTRQRIVKWVRGRGGWLTSTETLLLVQIFAADPGGEIIWRDISTRTYKTGAEDDSHLDAHANWLEAAADVVEATNGLDEAMQDCRRHLADLAERGMAYQLHRSKDDQTRATEIRHSPSFG